MWTVVAQAKVVLVDETLSSSSTTLHIPASTPNALTKTVQLAGRINVLSAARVREANVIYRWVEIHPPAPTAGVRVNPHGTFIFDCGPGEYYVAPLPGIHSSLVLPPEDGVRLDIDLAAGPVAALVNLLISGPWCNPFGQQIAGVAEAYLQQRTYGAIYIPQ